MNKKRIDIADSGALSDLAFLLIIFFIVIAVFNVNHGFMLGLPKKNSTKIVNVDDIIKINLNSSGDLFFNNEPISILVLEKDVSVLLSNSPNLTFLLKIDPEVKYQKVVEVIEIARKLDIENFSFSMTDGASN